MDQVPGTDYQIVQGEGALSYSVDSLFLSYFARPKGQVLDLGCGPGILFFRLLGKGAMTGYTGIDTNPQALDYFKKSLEENSLPYRPDLRLEDVGDLSVHGHYDTVITNPPYFTGKLQGKDPGKNQAKHQGPQVLDLFIERGAYSLKPLGFFYMVLPVDRLVDGLVLMRSHGLEVKRAQTLAKKEGKGPHWIALEGRKGARPGLQMDRDLFLDRDYDWIYSMK